MHKLRLRDLVLLSARNSHGATNVWISGSTGRPSLLSLLAGEGGTASRGLKSSSCRETPPPKQSPLSQSPSRKKEPSESVRSVDGLPSSSSNIRWIPRVVNNLPNRKPLHQSTENTDRSSRGSSSSEGYSGPGEPRDVDGLSAQDLRLHLTKAYDDALHFCRSKKLPDDVDPTGVFSCNRLDLRKIEIYGFDYDYTLASYLPELEHLIYNLGRESMLEKFKYPEAIRSLEYNPNFAVRGLHYDIQKGLLLKVDSFMQIQLGCVYRGLTPVSEAEVLEIYKGRKLPATYIEPPNPHLHHDARSLKMVQLADLFSVPEMNLLCNVIEYLHQNNIDYHPQSLFWDVKESVQSIHPVMHTIVEKNPQKYLEFDPLLREYLTTLKQNGKKVFLITNSPYHFVEKGLSYIVGEDWLDIFDVTVVSARKPHFFSDDSIPFRKYDPKQDARLWDKVNELEKGQVYYGGTLKQFQKLTGWSGDKVVYFGDHAYTDLADVTLHHGWRTGAIIKELEYEIETLNSPDFKSSMNWLQFLTSLLETYQDLDSNEVQDIIKAWQNERNQIRKNTKIIFNEQFGSLFRTHLNPTFFSKRLFRFADIYTSSVTNLMKYSTRHTFYPRRGALPHEYRSWFN